MADIPPAILGLLHQIDDDEWTEERREAFMLTFDMVLDFVKPVGGVYRARELMAGETLELEAREIDRDDAERLLDVTDKRSGTNVKWFEVIQSLVDGVLDEFVCTKKLGTAKTTVTTLHQKYPGIVAKVIDNGDETADIKVRLGAYRG